MEVADRLKCRADPEQHRLVERSANDLHPDREPIVIARTSVEAVGDGALEAP
jgi:hypothetical protein